eukprot:COSAG04_NODE_4286_length_2184_cov_1.406715_1_plen_48_part_10
MPSSMAPFALLLACAGGATAAAAPPKVIFTILIDDLGLTPPSVPCTPL